MIAFDRPFLSFDPVTEEDVRKIVLSSKPTNCVLDPFPANILKDYLDTMLPLITRLINYSLSSTFHSSWKVASVKPLIKKAGLEQVPSNYRPVSNLQYISKLVEKCALQQLTKHFDSHRLLPAYQSAYRTSFSTETALMKLHNDILSNMEQQKVTAFVGLDLSAAFDTVNHDVLLSVLRKSFGVKDQALKWIDSYLRPRSVFVQIGDVKSEQKAVDFSVPQGSILGPVLFNVYSSTLSNEVDKHSVSLFGYADDHGVYKSFFPSGADQEHESLMEVEHCLNNVYDWMCFNRLKMNASKTEYILFGSKQQLAKCKSESISVVDDVIHKTNLLVCTLMKTCLSNHKLKRSVN